MNCWVWFLLYVIIPLNVLIISKGAEKTAITNSVYQKFFPTQETRQEYSSVLIVAYVIYEERKMKYEQKKEIRFTSPTSHLQ